MGKRTGKSAQGLWTRSQSSSQGLQDVRIQTPRKVTETRNVEIDDLEETVEPRLSKPPMTNLAEWTGIIESSSGKKSWAEQVGNLGEQVCKQGSIWEKFDIRKMRNTGFQLDYVEPKREGTQVFGEIDLYDIESEIDYWANSIVCYVLGAHPPFGVMKGFIQRVWGKFKISKVAMLKNGILIVRFESDEQASQFRPIALCNVLYKCISKMICSRLQLVVPELVSINQAAFVKDRALAHNVLIVQDLIRCYSRKTSPRCLLKIDLRKAYDMLSWTFLRDVLIGYNMPPKFVDWIIVCISTTRYSVKLNGGVFGFFDGKRGIRQGDPMSPLLFVLAMEYLTRLFKLMGELADFRFHPLCKGFRLNHLIFADDLMVFSKGHQPSLVRIMEALGHFTAVSGLIANEDKSNLYVAGVTEEVKESLLLTTGFVLGQFPMRYLGLPLSPKKWSKMECQSLIDKITSRIQHVSSKALSYAGRIQIIISILTAVHGFWGAVFVLPGGVVKEVDRRCRMFLWGSNEERRKVSLVAWDKVCGPRKYGGLNIRGCHNWNVAYIGKLVWQIENKKDMLWVRWIHGVYLKGTSFWDHIPPLDSCWYWRKLHKLKGQMQGWFNRGAYALTRNGKYSVSRSYVKLLGNLQPLQFHKQIWTSMALPRHRVIVWLAAQNRLLTKDRMTKMKINCSKDCVLCGSTAEESHSHLFHEYKWFRELQLQMRDWLGLPLKDQPLHQKFAELRRLKGTKLQRDFIAGVYAGLIYHTWAARNAMIFKQVYADVHVHADLMKKELQAKLKLKEASKNASRCRSLFELECN